MSGFDFFIIGLAAVVLMVAFKLVYAYGWYKGGLKAVQELNDIIRKEMK